MKSFGKSNSFFNLFSLFQTLFVFCRCLPIKVFFFNLSLSSKKSLLCLVYETQKAFYENQ